MFMDIYTVESDGRVRAKISQMFGSNGPYVMDGQRLDTLESVKILLDESTKTIHETGSGTAKAKTSSVVGRALVGGVLLGGVGAIAGAVTAKKDSTTTTKRWETINVKLIVELKFSNGRVINSLVKSQSGYAWLVKQSILTPATDDELSDLKLAAEDNARTEAQEKERWGVVDNELDEAPPESTTNMEVGFIVGGIIIGFISGIWAGFESSSFGLFVLVVIVVGGASVGIAAGIEKSYARKYRDYQDKRVGIYNKLYLK